MPKISIIVVNYNYSKYLDERIQSFLNQTYQDFELFLIDNGSTDNSKEIINKYKEDKRVKIKLFPENIHPFKRWNNAIDLTQGEYLLLAAADDSCDPRLLEKLVEKLDENPSVGLAFTQSWEVDAEGNRLRSCKGNTDDLDRERWSKDFIDVGRNECRYLFFQCTIPNPSGALLRRSIVDKAGRLDEQMQMCSDWLLWAKMLTISDIAYVAEPLNYFRKPTNGISLRLKVLDNVEEIEESLRIFHYLLQEGIEAPKSFCETKYYYLVKSWLVKMFLELTPFITNLRIYSLFLGMGLGMNYRLLKHIFKVLRRKSLKLYLRVFAFNQKSSVGLDK